MGHPAGATLWQWQNDVGYDLLVAAKGPAVPAGAGIVVSMVEAPEGAASNYMPGVSSPEFTSVTFTPGHTGAANYSGHADGMAHWFVGNSRGISKATTSVTMYEANRWLSDILNYGGSQPPTAQPFAVQNHSWVHDLGSPASNNLSALRRFDYLIETGNTTAVVGANNNDDSDSVLPKDGMPNLNQAHLPLFASSFNGIVVGASVGTHSRGTTMFAYGSGRYKPDLVAPAYSAVPATGPNTNFTSIATARTSSAAGVIRGVLQGSLGDNSETAKAILMAGATKTEFLPGIVGSPNGPANALGFIEPSTGVVNNWQRTATQPLDDIFGAGELNIMNSYLMTVGGRNAGVAGAPGAPVSNYGWDYQDRKNDSAVGNIFYSFVVPEGSSAPELSIILSWNANITDTNPGSPFTPSESLQNLDLRLYRPGENVNAEPMDTLELQPRRSVSTVDNVEHIYLTDLDPGTYTLKVTGAANWDYGLAWRMSTLFDQSNADFDGDFAVTGTDFLIWQRNVGKLVGALPSEGDANGDGAVDAADLNLLKLSVVPQPPTARLAIAAVPEPASVVSSAAATVFVALALRRKLRRVVG